MRLKCKDTNNGTFTMFPQRGRYALSSYYYGDKVSSVPDPTQGASYNSNIEFRSYSPGFCYVAYGEDDLMDIMSDNGLDINIAIDYIENERREVESHG